MQSRRQVLHRNLIAINTAFSEEIPNEQLQLALVTASGTAHSTSLTTDSVEFVRWHPSNQQLLIKAADERDRFGVYDVASDHLRWIQTNSPHCQLIDFLPSGEEMLVLQDGTPHVYPVEANATGTQMLDEKTNAVTAATVTECSLVFHQHDSERPATLTQYCNETEEQILILTSEPAQVQPIDR